MDLKHNLKLKIKSRCKKLVLISFLLLSSKAFCQMYPVQKYSVQQGLSHSNVFSIFQDKKGFLWFCTAYGLSRFDGNLFQNFTSENGLNNNLVISLMQLTDEKIWINGFSRVNILRNDSVLPSGIDENLLPVKCIYSELYNGEVWLIGSYKDYGLFRINNKTVKKISIPGYNGNTVKFTKIISDPDLGLILCSDIGLFTYHKKTGFKRFLENIVNEKVTDIEKDKKGNYWVSIENYILEICQGRLTYSYKLPSKQTATRLTADSENNIWAAIPQLGVALISNHNMSVITDNLGIGKIIINDIFEDSEHNVWIATHGDGVYRITSQNVRLYPVDKNTLNVYAKTIVIHGKTLMIGTFGTISKIEDKKLTSFPTKILRSTDCIYFIKKAEADNVLIGLPTGMILKDLKQPLKEIFMPGNGAISICTDHTGRTWVGSYINLDYFEGSSYSKRISEPLMYGRRINSIMEDHRLQLWLGTDSGVYIINKKRSSVSFQNIKITGRGFVNQVYEDSKKRIWIATDRGLACKNHAGWHVFTKANGLAHNKCNTVCEDAVGNIWIGTLKGLNRIEAGDFKIAEFGEGIFQNEILSIAVQNNDVYVGTVNGVSTITFKKNTDPFHQLPLPLYITSATVNNTRILYPLHLVVPYNGNKLKIEFIALNYNFPAGIEYRYCISQQTEKWNLTTNTSIEIPLLSAGNYEFIVQARISHGEWGPPVKLFIEVPAPFWKTTFFTGGMIICVLCGVYMLLRWWFRRSARKELKEQMIHNQVNYLRQQALQALINPHFIFNCMNSIQYYLHQNDARQANKYLARFGHLIRMTMEQAQETFILLPEELQRIAIYLELEKLRCGDRLSFNISMDTDLDASTIYIPNMILQQYIENAIWHGIMPMKETGGHIEIRIMRIDPDYFKIVISDNGVGMSDKPENEELHKSYGLKLTGERLALLETLSKKTHRVVISGREQNAGTRVEIILPLKINFQAV